jgi:hypothetical protein
VIKSDNNITINAKTLNNTAYRYDAKQDDNDGYYGYDVNEKVVKSDYVLIPLGFERCFGYCLACWL